MIQIGVTVWKRSTQVNIGDFWSCVASKFDEFPKKKTMGYLFYITSSFVHHFKAIGEFKLELQSGNLHLGSKLAGFFCPVWPWNLTHDLEKQYGTSSIRYFNLFASFHSHLWIQTGVTVRKRSIGVKFGDFFVPCDLEIWQMTWKTTGPSSLLLQALYIIS